MKVKITTPFRTLAFAIVTLLMFAVAVPTFAQASKQLHIQEPIWKAHLGEQIAGLLESPVVKHQEQGLQLATYYAANYSDEIDMQKAVPALLSIYDHAEVENYRIMALAALTELGDTESMYHLVESLRTEESPRVRRITVAALVTHSRKNALSQAPLAGLATAIGTDAP